MSDVVFTDLTARERAALAAILEAEAPIHAAMGGGSYDALDRLRAAYKEQHAAISEAVAQTMMREAAVLKFAADET
jgi:hypothetical protein